jgi:4-hydroxyphenylpyruvate dioxygenase
LHALAERAASRGLRIGYEALAWGRHVNRYGAAWDIVRRAGHPALGLVLDSFHTLSLGDDPAGIASIPGERIFFVQMADAPLLAMDVIQWARHHRNFPGQGQLDVEGFFAQVLRAGYTGTLSLEIFNDVFRETPNRRVAVDAMRSLLHLESRVRSRWTGADTLGRGVAATVDLAEPPAATALGGIGFVEFGVDATTAASLELLLAQLGFVPDAPAPGPRQYRQGEIVLAIGGAPGTDARARFDEQGPCVSAIGLVSDEPVRATARATALCSVRFEAPGETGESRGPAIRSPGGMPIHFIAAAPARGAVPGAGLTRIDHLALGLSPDQLDTWMLFSRSVLALEPGSSQELADPFGLVRTGSVANGERSVRLVLNVSLGARTQTARAVVAAGGKPAVHHIALATDDIVATVELLRARGVAFVPISPNYHDDLAARFDLDPGRLAAMRRLGLLFDRNELGDYLHIYTENFADRFFFEIVERSGYDAYGATNAPARMASHEQSTPAFPHERTTP